MKLSVVVCTYQRTEPVAQLLRCLSAQTFSNFELLLIDGGGDAGHAQSLASVRQNAAQLNVKVIASAKGLTRQRNAGLKAANGDVICLLDDDVAFAPDFLQRIVDLFERPGMEDVGGLSGYDVTNYPQSINVRWRMRRWLRTIPSLQPGDINRLGASVPVSFLPPFAGCKPVGFFYGFCMIYRRAAITGISFDEELPTYGGEDRDFSFRVAKRWRLLISGDLQLQHFRSQESRDSLVERTYQTGFGAGRTFAKHRTRFVDYAALIWSMCCEFLIDMLAFVQTPSIEKLRMPFARIAGTMAGVHSNPTRVAVGALRRDAIC